MPCPSLAPPRICRCCCVGLHSAPDIPLRVSRSGMISSDFGGRGHMGIGVRGEEEWGSLVRKVMVLLVWPTSSHPRNEIEGNLRESKKIDQEDNYRKWFTESPAICMCLHAFLYCFQDQTTKVLGNYKVVYQTWSTPCDLASLLAYLLVVPTNPIWMPEKENGPRQLQRRN